MTKRKAMFLTVFIWFVGSGAWLYCYVISVLNDPRTVGYERFVIFPTLGFLFYRFPYLLGALILALCAEVILFDRADYHKIK
jgi:hypothetical protein